MNLMLATWKEVEAFSRDAVVVIPSGSIEQHGPHLPLVTDTLIVTSVAEEAERALKDHVLLTPTVRFGASEHHLPFAGSLTTDFESYIGTIMGIVRSLARHGFYRFLILNGHGGNTSPNDIAVRKLKIEMGNATLARCGYFEFCEEAIAGSLTGPLKRMAHACEAETSLVMHLAPELVRLECLRDDGLLAEPPLISPLHRFDEISEEGSFGYASFASAAKGKVIFDAAVAGVVEELRGLASGYVLRGLPSPT